MNVLFPLTEPWPTVKVMLLSNFLTTQSDGINVYIPLGTLNTVNMNIFFDISLAALEVKHFSTPT